MTNIGYVINLLRSEIYFGMDNQFAFSNSLSPNYKLSRAASFSELSTSKKVTFQEKYELTHGGLIKQYSCEQIFDQNSDKRYLNFF